MNISDQCFTKLISAVFLNVFLDIKRKIRGGKKVIEEKKEWLGELIKWAEEEKYWFACMEEFLRWDIPLVRNKIKGESLNALLKLETLKPKKVIIEKQLRKIQIPCSHCGEMIVRSNQCKKARCFKCHEKLQKESNKRYRDKNRENKNHQV